MLCMDEVLYTIIMLKGKSLSAAICFLNNVCIIQIATRWLETGYCL